MSQALGLYTIASALKSAEEYLHQSLDWQAVNKDQERFLRLLPTLKAGFPYIPTLDGIARPTAKEINRWLAEKGFSIHLDPWPEGSKIFGVAAANDSTVEWRKEGLTKEHDQPINILGKPAFRQKDMENITFWQSSLSREPVIRVATKSGDVVCFLKYPQASPSGFALLDLIQNAQKGLGEMVYSFTGANIPMVKFDLRPDISWIKKMWCMEGIVKWWIDQAVQQIKFGMNEFGARFMEATAMIMRMGTSQSRYYDLDGPFLAWVERPNVEIPPFLAHITPDDFSNPGDLSKL